MDPTRTPKLIALAALTTLLVASAAATGSGQPEKCVDYDFLYDDGHTDNGLLCGDDASNELSDGLHVTSLHVSCSDLFEGGTSDKSDLDGHTVASFSIVWMKDGELQKQCGSDDTSGDTGGDGEGKCVAFDFLYDDGHMDSAKLCGDAAVKDVEEGLHVISLHVSCSDEFIGGEGQKSDLDGHLVDAYHIVWTKDGEVEKECGEAFGDDDGGSDDGDDGSDGGDDGSDDGGDGTDGNACPTDFAALAHGDASVSLAWSLADVQGYQVFRGTGDEDPLLVAELDGNATGYFDTDTEAGATYTYHLVLLVDGVAVPCGQVEVTSVPVFPSLLAGVAGIGASLLGYAFVRRR